MASYNSHAKSGLPLTPPDSIDSYGYADMQYDPYLYHHSMRPDTMHDYSQNYMQPQMTGYTPAYQPSLYQASSTAMSSNALPPISTYYEPLGAPVLPPLRMQDRMYADDYSHNRVHEYARDVPRQVKEEKTVGGVSAKLDYDIDRMTNFVVSITQYMYDLHCSPICLADIDITRSFHQNVQSPPAFRKWVHQVLSATRLPSATILLSLHYLSDRLRVFPSSVPATENQIYRLLAVALILGSKFLDDNTFINRSWSDVTAIKVSELNKLEIMWLGLIEYGLHVDNSCVEAWVDAWNKYNLDQTRDVPARLSPLDTHIASSTRSRFSPYPTPYSSSTMSSRTFDSVQTPASYRTPYSAVDPWAPAERSPYEDYYKRTSTTRYPTLSDFDEQNNRRVEQSRVRGAYGNYSSVPYSAATAPSYTPTWEQNAWYPTTHRNDCTCSSCNYRQWKPYGGHSMGIVMG